LIKNLIKYCRVESIENTKSLDSNIWWYDDIDKV